LRSGDDSVAAALETVEGDAQRLPRPDARADAVMLVSMLHHVGRCGEC
jgi:ubiquinone/menaquinone biosynthesis C-methylase UbiE